MTQRDHQEYLECLGFAPTPVARRGENLLLAEVDESPKNSDSVESATLPQPSRPSKPSTSQTQWLFILDKASQSNPAALQMFSKMLSALQLCENQMKSVFATRELNVDQLLQQNPAEKVVLMGSGLQLNAELKYWKTYSPAECLNDASLKRPVWDILQAAQKGHEPQ